jgi:hypothetical protein
MEHSMSCCYPEGCDCEAGPWNRREGLIDHLTTRNQQLIAFIEYGFSMTNCGGQWSACRGYEAVSWHPTMNEAINAALETIKKT